MSYSYSDVLTFQRCPKKYEYSAIRKLQRKAKSKPLTRGIMFHRMLMGEYLGEDASVVFDQLLAEATKYSIDDEIATGETILELAADMVDRYLAHYDDEWEVLHVEEQFTATTESGVEITFTPDLVIRDSTGVWIVDHKTSSALPKDGLPMGNLQAYLYSSVMRQVYPDFKGFIFNYVRAKTPTQPRLTKTGEKRVADINRIDTTFEILRDFIMDEAPELMSDPATQRKLAELRDNDRYFWREYVFTTDEISDTIIEEVVFTTTLIDRCVEADTFPRAFLPYAGVQECDKCPFRELCIAELRGYNTETILPLYEERDMSHKDYDHDMEDVWQS